MLRVSLAAFLLSTGIIFAAPCPASAASEAPSTGSNEPSAASSKPGWLPVIVARGDLKEWIDSTPIVDRPNRPFHFYGNTVRRRYYRSNPLPQNGDTAKGGAAPVPNGKSS